MAPIESGKYIITNRKHKNVAILPDANDHSDVVAGIQEDDPGEMWKVDRLSNGTYKIQNLDHSSFVNCENSAKASLGDGVVGGTRPQQWKIVEMRTKGDYCIFPTLNINVCWSLRDGESNTPIVLGYPPNAPQSQWNFTKVEDTLEDTQLAKVSTSSPAVRVQPPSTPLERMANKGLHLTEQNSSSTQEAQTVDADPLFIHSALLPALDVTLYEALATDLMPCSNPLDWIKANADHIDNVVHQLLILTQRKELNHITFGSTMIYRRLIVYIFAHLMLCTGHNRLLNEFGETLQRWTSWSNITTIQNHQLIKDHLYDLFQRGLNVQSNLTLHSEEAFRKLVALDVIGLCAHLTVMVTNNDIYKEVLLQRGLVAQSLLNLLQARLDFPMDPQHKARQVKALHRLSRASGLYPECLALKGIEMEVNPVDRGGFGDVYKGVLHGQEIAVKALRIYQTSDLVKLLKEFSSEAVLWRQLSHPNVLPFYGVYHLEEATPRLCLTAPWMENGNVVEFLKRHPDTYCVHLALDIAQGLEHLHNLAPSIIHGDLKGVNVLITRSTRACLADFGLATTMADSKSMAMSYSSSGKSGGTMRWQAPELLSIGAEEIDSNQYNSKASDIYAFACVCYEMFSGKMPFSENPHDIQVILGVMRGKRPARPTHALGSTRGLNDELWHLIQICWEQDPTRRPAAEQVAEQLRALPNWQDDSRPVDDFEINFPSQILYNHHDHPFSSLADHAGLAW